MMRNKCEKELRDLTALNHTKNGAILQVKVLNLQVVYQIKNNEKKPTIHTKQKTSNHNPNIFHLYSTFICTATQPIIQVKTQTLRQTHSQPTDKQILSNP